MVYRFLLSGRWLGLFALAVAVAVGCVVLGSWQWTRREQRLARNAEVVANYDRAPVPLAEAVPDPAAFPTGSTWTPVAVRGQYLADRTVLVRNRNREGVPGYRVLVPLRSEDDEVLLVDRGFVTIGQTGERPDEVPEPPEGVVDVVSRLRQPEPATDRPAPAGQTLRIAPATLLPEIVDDPAAVLVTGAYGDLASESPAPAQSPLREPRPALDEGPHLSYALQWVVFAVGALVGFVLLARRTAEDDAAAAGGEAGAPTPTPAPEPSTRRRRPTAEEEEDALLDAAERARGR